MCAPPPGKESQSRARAGERAGTAVALEGAGDTLMAPVRGEWEDEARQFPVTGELRDNGHKVERREVEAV